MMAEDGVTWYSKISGKLSWAKGRLCSRDCSIIPPSSPSSCDGKGFSPQARFTAHPAFEEHAWSAFDAADLLEQGRVNEPQCPRPASFVKSLEDVATGSSLERELTVVRDWGADGVIEHTLLDESDRPLLVARASSDGEGCYDLFLSPDVVQKESVLPHEVGRPAFKLWHSTEARSWELSSARCWACEHRGGGGIGSGGGFADRCLLRISQERRAIGGGHAMSMELEMPTDGQVWCEVCRRHDATDAAASQAPLALISRLPEWNTEQESLVLDYTGRCAMASAKNFQLVSAGQSQDDVDAVVLQFGRMRKDRFCLDVKAPLCAVQAFAAALSTANWA